jgi:hypothetical protein
MSTKNKPSRHFVSPSRDWLRFIPFPFDWRKHCNEIQNCGWNPNARRVET